MQAGSSAALMLAIMFLGSLGLWIGLPLACLYVGSHVQDATHSVGVAIMAMAACVVVGIVAVVPFLGYLNRKHMEVRAARGRDTYGQAPLEGVLVVSAGVALAGFVVWFFFFSGTAPFPVGN
jgi:heme/copper-type cytochrome/quinol oxidase subunit 2